MTERPILFSTDMVRAIMQGRKTQTRRVVKGMALDWLQPEMFTPEYVASTDSNLCPFGKIGDILWVRETFFLEKYFNGLTENDLIKYKADYGAEPVAWNWKPSIFLPKERSRIWLEITDIRIERLNDISEVDARWEGVALGTAADSSISYKDYGLKIFCFDDAKLSFMSLWDSINGKPTRKNPNPPSWESNQWVWAITFKVLSTTGKPTLPSGSKTRIENLSKGVGLSG